MKQGKVSRTALKVAAGVVVAAQEPRWRHRLPSGSGPLTRRLLAASGHPIWDSELPYRFARSKLGRLAVANNADVYEGLVERKAFIDRHVREAVAGGVGQVAVIGAGFDTLCLRLAPEFPQVRFVEIDHPATAPAKHAGIAELGRPNNLELAVADLGQRTVAETLEASTGWSPGARSVFIAEGLLMYLTVEQIERLLADVRSCSGRESRVLVTHLTHLDVMGRLSRLWVSLLGEPWLSAHSRPAFRAFAERLGWTVLEQDQPRADRNLEGFAALEWR